MNSNVAETAIKALHQGIYKKNIHYLFKTPIDVREFEMVKAMAGSPGQSSWMIQQAHRMVGIQMHVSKQVSDDLLASDFSQASKVENVPWMSEVIEVYFEDPLLPTILVMKTSPEKVQKWFPQLHVGLKEKEYISACMQEGSGMDGRLLSLQLKPDMYDAFLTKGETETMDRSSIFSVDLSEQDNCSISFMMNLVLKVFAFASIPNYKPKPLTKKQMYFGGKPEVKGRPQRPSFKTDYLPSTVYPKQTPSTPSEGREFHGRRGHIRWYHSEKFVNRKGTWDFIKPSIDPSTGKYPERHLFKVR